MSDNDLDPSDMTPPLVAVEDLSQPLIRVDPTIEGVSIAIVNVYQRLMALTVGVNTIARRVTTAVSQDECESRRVTCPAAAEKTNKPVSDGWEWLRRRVPVLVSMGVLLGMVGSAWWWTAKTFASVRVGQEEMKVQVIDVIQKQVQQISQSQRDTDRVLSKIVSNQNHVPSVSPVVKPKRGNK